MNVRRLITLRYVGKSCKCAGSLYPTSQQNESNARMQEVLILNLDARLLGTRINPDRRYRSISGFRHVRSAMRSVAALDKRIIGRGAAAKRVQSLPTTQIQIANRTREDNVFLHNQRMIRG